MLTQNKKYTAVIILLLMMILAACTNGGGSEPAADDANDHMEEMEHVDGDMEEMDHDEDDMEDMDHEHEGQTIERIPNPGGASIRIISPADGDEFAEGEQIIVAVEVENFTLGEDGNHWHVYVDGTSFGMVVGGNTDQPLSGVEPGEHEISVHLAGGDHIEFIEGDSIIVVVK